MRYGGFQGDIVKGLYAYCAALAVCGAACNQGVSTTEDQTQSHGGIQQPGMRWTTPAPLEYRAWVVRPNPRREFLRFSNHSGVDKTFSIGLNGNGIATVADLLDTIRSLPDEVAGEPDYRKAWRFLRDSRYHFYSYITDTAWAGDAMLYLASAGFGLCGHSATALGRVWKAMGYESRKWGLEGHVVSELYADGRWQMFDVDLEVYYTDAGGNVVGVEALQAQPELISLPVTPLSTAKPSAYSSTIADIYASAENNESYELPSSPAHTELLYRLPPGATLDLPFRFEPEFRAQNGDVVPAFSNARLTLPSTFSGPVRIPLLLHTLDGKGTILVDGQPFELGSEELANHLDQRAQSIRLIDVVSLTEPLTVTYLLNPRLNELLPETLVEIEGDDVWGVRLTVVTRAPPATETRTWTVGADLSTQLLRIANPGTDTAEFEVALNGKELGSMDGLAAHIGGLADAHPGEPDYAKAWRFIRDLRYDAPPFITRQWVDTPTIAINSTGFGRASNVAESLAQLWRHLGYQSRTWRLGGHSVSEVYAGGRWQMYDARFDVYYRDEQQQVAGVNALAANPELITEPVLPVSPRSYAYSDTIAQIYATTGDNTWNAAERQYVDTRMSFALPPGAVLELPHRFEPELAGANDNDIPEFQNARLTVPSSFSGVIASPFVIQSISGEGTIALNGVPYALGSPELAERLNNQLPYEYAFYPEITNIDLDGPLVITYLVNSKTYALSTVGDVQLIGTNLDQLQLQVSTPPPAVEEEVTEL